MSTLIESLESKYRSRKFIVTMTCIVLGTLMASIGKLDGSLSAVLTTGMVAYNISNAWSKK